MAQAPMPDMRQMMQMMQQMGMSTPNMGDLTVDQRRQLTEQVTQATRQLFQSTPMAQQAGRHHPGGLDGLLQEALGHFLGGEPAPDPDAAAMIGKRVVLCGIKSSPELNGSLGTVASFDLERRRFRINVDGREREIALVPANIRLATDVDQLPLAESLRACLRSEAPPVVDVVRAAVLRATAAGAGAIDAHLVREVSTRLEAMEQAMAEARNRLRAFDGKPVPIEQSSRRSVITGLTPVLAGAAAAGVPEEELRVPRRSLRECLALSLSTAAEARDVEDLCSLLDSARDSLTVLGAEAPALQQEVSVFEQRLSEVRAAADRAKMRQEYDLPEPVNPDQFKCPITMLVMVDPVTVVDGFSYERSAIEEHLKQSCTSPMTREQLTNTTLVANTALKQLIRDHEAAVQDQLLRVSREERLARTQSRNVHTQEKEKLQRERDELAAKLAKLQQACASSAHADPEELETSRNFEARVQDVARGAVTLQLVRSVSLGVAQEEQLSERVADLEQQLRCSRWVAGLGFAVAAAALLFRRQRG